MIRHDPLMLRVRAIESLSPTLKRIKLEAANGEPLPVAGPGAHLNLTLSAPQKVFRNSYSVISGGGFERDHYELVVRRVPNSRGGSAFVHEGLKEGDVVPSTLPNTLFPMQTGARKRLLIGGGIGVTPLLSFVASLRETGDRFEMHQFVREEDGPVFAKLLKEFGSRNIHLHASDDPPDFRPLLERQPLGTDIYMCGPDGMMAAVDAAAEELGWPASHVQREVFGAAGGEPFTAKLARSGIEIEVGEKDTLLEAIEEAGVPINSLCRGGACGQCLTNVLEGELEHRDHFLSKEEKESGRLIMPCVSRAKSGQLVLDI